MEHAGPHRLDQILQSGRAAEDGTMPPESRMAASCLWFQRSTMASA
jgi:hypothetical protein